MVAKKKLLVVWLIGLMSGFTIMITGNTLNFWLAKEGIDVKTVGIFSLVTLPYAINFIWGPIFDTKKVPVLAKVIGNRISWILIIQLCLSFTVLVLSSISPRDNLLLFGLIALITGFFSSAQDIVLGAFRIELTDNTKQGIMAGIYVFGYRVGMLLSSSGAIYIASCVSWNIVYKLFSFFIILFPIVILLAGKIHTSSSSEKEDIQTLNLNNFLNSKFKCFNFIFFKNLEKKSSVILIILFLMLYRLPDNFIGIMINPFLIHIGYNEFEIATASKLFGITAAIFGGLIATYSMKYLSVFQGLFFFGIIHNLAHILFFIQEIYGRNIYILFLITGFENVTAGMTMTAYIAYISSLCYGRFKATQYSFLISIMGFSRSVFPIISGYLVSINGWKLFYIFVMLTAIPWLVLVPFIHKLSITSKNTHLR